MTTISGKRIDSPSTLKKGTLMNILCILPWYYSSPPKDFAQIALFFHKEALKTLCLAPFLSRNPTIS
jgi:hypothetical protein